MSCSIKQRLSPEAKLAAEPLQVVLLEVALVVQKPAGTDGEKRKETVSERESGPPFLEVLLSLNTWSTLRTTMHAQLCCEEERPARLSCQAFLPTLCRGHCASNGIARTLAPFPRQDERTGRSQGRSSRPSLAPCPSCCPFPLPLPLSRPNRGLGYVYGPSLFLTLSARLSCVPVCLCAWCSVSRDCSGVAPGVQHVERGRVRPVPVPLLLLGLVPRGPGRRRQRRARRLTGTKSEMITAILVLRECIASQSVVIGTIVV